MQAAAAAAAAAVAAVAAGAVHCWCPVPAAGGESRGTRAAPPAWLDCEGAWV